MNAPGARPRPLAIALTLTAVVYVGALVASLARNDGHVIYALDDAYIHMAMAKNLATHGVWGVTPDGFTSSSSSPLWVLLLAASYRLFGVGPLVPLLLNVIFAVSLLVAADRVLRRFGVAPGARTVGLSALVLLTPVVPIAFCGLEHLLHATASVLFAGQIAAAVAEPGSTRPPRGRDLVATAALVVAARYEGLFLVAAGALLLVARRRFALAALVVGAGLLPAIGYGLFALHHGWPFLPTSVLLKAGVSHHGWEALRGVLSFAFARSLFSMPHILVAVMAGTGALVVARRRGGALASPWSAMILMVLIASLLHMQLGRGGWFYRYEAYLMALWAVTLTAAWPHLAGGIAALFRLGRGHAAAAGLIAAVVALPPLVRAARAHVETPAATAEIYAQQYQMGLFIQRFFPGRRIAANDIGAIDYLADIALLDLYGLASKDVVDARLGAGYDTARIDALARAHGTEIAMVYDDWFAGTGGLPRSWRRVGAWSLPTQVVLGGKTVTFYAVDPRVADALARGLSAFASALPPTVTQSGSYLAASTDGGGPPAATPRVPR